MTPSCAKTAVHPGSANTFDSTTYDALVTIQGAIEQAKIGVTDANKPLLNKIIAGYNAAESAYTTYHQAALAGNATAAQQTALQNQVASIQADIAKLKGPAK
jgi:hypothetical protein